ncbi:hypothetical protein X551_03818 [Methylibium sp. T29]|nr:hypothetical protein X551_03818 [Methylibium sp. T29]
MLHAVAELAEHAVGHVERVLRHEIDAHALGAHQPHHQLDALDQSLRGVGEQQVSLVEEEHQLGLLQVAHLGQQLEQLAEHPQQEGGVEPRRGHQLVGGQDVDHALAVCGLHEVTDVEHRLAEELVAALFLDLHQAALDGAHAGGADVAVFGLELLGVVAHVLQHRAQVLQVQQQHAVVVGDLEHQRQHALLGLVEREHAAQQQRAHVGHGGAHRVALGAEHVPQGGRAGERGRQVQAAVLQHLGELVVHAAGLGDTGQVALHVGQKDRHADLRELLGQRLQRDGLAGAGGPGDQPVAVGQGGQQRAFDLAVLGDQQGFGHEVLGRGAGEDAEASTKIFPILSFPKREQHGRPFQMGQHPAPQGPPG